MYAIDASALIDGWVRYYPPDVLPTLWQNIDGLITADRLRSPDDVKFELERGADELYNWCCAREQLFRAPSADLQDRVSDIVNRFPTFLPERTPDGIWADPYVIGLAQLKGPRLLRESSARPQQHASQRSPIFAMRYTSSVSHSSSLFDAKAGDFDFGRDVSLDYRRTS